MRKIRPGWNVSLWERPLSLPVEDRMLSKRDLQPGLMQLLCSSLVKECKTERHSMGNTCIFPCGRLLRWEGRYPEDIMKAVAELCYHCLGVPYEFSLFSQLSCSWSCLLVGLLLWLPFISLECATPHSSPYVCHSLHVWDLSQKPYYSWCPDLPSGFLPDCFHCCGKGNSHCLSALLFTSNTNTLKVFLFC